MTSEESSARPAGAAEPQGPAGPAGPAGGLSGYQIVTGDEVFVSGDDFNVSGSATCPIGTVVLGGGALTEDPTADIALSESFPDNEGGIYSWWVTLNNTDPVDNAFTPYAICANTA